MGCASSIDTSTPSYQEYITIKEEVFASKEFKFLKTFYNQLWPTAYKVIKLSKNYEDIFIKIKGLTEAIQEFGQFDILKPVTDVLSVIPKSFKPMIEKARLPIFNALLSAIKFAKQCWDFQSDLTQLYKLLKKLEKGKIVDPKSRFEHAGYIMKCLKEKLKAHIKVIEIDKNLYELRSIVNKISRLNSIAGPVNKLKKFLCTKLFGISVLSLLGDGEISGLKGVIIKATLKGLSLGIKKAVSGFKIDSLKYSLSKFPTNIQVPQSGWLGLHYAYDFKKKRLDLISSLPKQWAIDNLGQENQCVNVMKDYERPPKNKKKKAKKSKQKNQLGQNSKDDDDDDDEYDEQKESIFNYTPDKTLIKEMKKKGRESIGIPNPTQQTLNTIPNIANDLPIPLPGSFENPFPQEEKVLETLFTQQSHLEDLEELFDEEDFDKQSPKMQSDIVKAPLPAVV